MSKNAFLSRIHGSAAGRRSLCAVVLGLSCLPLLSGCGGGGGDVLATVGDRDVSREYYMDRLSKLTEPELPTDPDGNMLDPASLDSKQVFLNVIINKELMVLKAIELGYDTDSELEKIRETMLSHYATDIMQSDLFETAESEITAAEVEEYYAKRQFMRHFQFFICNFEDDALEARQKVIDGAPWVEVADEYNDGHKGPNNDYTMAVQYGTVDDNFERALYGLEEGQVSMPIETVYGHWIVRYTHAEKVRERPLDEEMFDRLRRTIVSRREKLASKDFFDDSLERHEFMMDETALWVIFQGLPEDEGLLDEETNQPIPKEKLASLDLPAEELERVFFSIRLDPDREADVWTIGRYAELYDQMSVFQRPKRHSMMGGVRNKIINDMLGRALLVVEARERGYFEDPRTVDAAKNKVEEVMVNRFYEEVIQYEGEITTEDIHAYWAEHGHEYKSPEEREGRVLVCRERERAGQAYEALTSGTPWEQVFAIYNRAQGPGSLDPVTVAANVPSQEKDAVFALSEIGEVTAPYKKEGGWCLMRLDKITAPVQLELDGLQETVSQRIRMTRRDALLNDSLLKWREEFGVEINENALAAAPSWHEMQDIQ